MDGSTFTEDQTVGAAAFALTNVYTGKNGTVIFRDFLGNPLNTTFSYTGVSDIPDGPANHKDYLVKSGLVHREIFSKFRKNMIN